MQNKNRMFWIILSMSFLIKLSCCLRMVGVLVPAYRLRGESVLMECQYDLQRDALYSVKWYRDNEEFYRYMPRLQPPQQSYRVDGIKVDFGPYLGHNHNQIITREVIIFSPPSVIGKSSAGLSDNNHVPGMLEVSKSDARTVSLRQLGLRSRGLFRCEVSAEAPSFASAHAEARMEVLYLPRDGPHISGSDESVGDTLELNCTSGRSHPAPELIWYIDDEEITNPDLLVSYPPSQHAHGLVSSTLGLRAPRPGRQGSPARVRCVARLAPHVWRARGIDAHLPDEREAMLLVRSGSSTSRYSSIILLCSLLASVGAVDFVTKTWIERIT